MGDIRDDLHEDLEWIQKRIIKYTAAAAILNGEKPPCFKPIVNPRGLAELIDHMDTLALEIYYDVLEEHIYL